MRKLNTLLGAVMALFACAFLAPAWAQEAVWRITAQQGAVRVVEPGRAPAEAVTNAPLAVGASVTTGADGRATLENGQQRIVVTPNSRMTIAPNSTDAMTRILQDLGSLLFQVDRRGEQHFRVETPLLAAVVKGTTFTVSSGADMSQVHVSQGLVEVRANAGNAVSDVAAGMTARIARGAPSDLVVETAQSTLSPDAAETPALDYSSVSDGVVGNTPAAGAPGRAISAGASANGNGGANANDFVGGPGASDSAPGQAIAAARQSANAVGHGSAANANPQGANSNAGGNSGNSNAGGNSGNSNAGGNSGNSNAGGNAGGNS